MKKIVENSQNQTVWIVDTVDDYDLSSPDIRDIDAIFIEMSLELSAYVADLIIKIRRNRWTKLYMKPVFTTISMDYFSNPAVRELIDGVEASVDAPKFIAKTNEINQIVNRYVDLSAEKDPLFFVYTLQLLRYNFARKKDLIYHLSEQSMIGYSRPLLFVTGSTGELIIEVLDELARISKEGYLNRKFQDKLHLCPQCHSVHLIYREICVKCGSAHLTAQPVIHHFRCSNVSPESDYIDGERLTCPKCHKHLRHLGVDYDKPSVVNICEACHFSSQNSNLVTQCLHCQKITPVEELVPFILYGYFYNDQTLAYLINPFDPSRSVEKLLQGIVPFKDFIQQIEQAVLKLETTELRGGDAETDHYLAVYALGFDIRYIDTQRRVSKELYVNIMQSIADVILQLSKVYNPGYPDVTFHNNQYMIFSDFLTSVQEKLDHLGEILERIEEMIREKYGDNIEAGNSFKHYKYKKSSNIVSFIKQIETI